MRIIIWLGSLSSGNKYVTNTPILYLQFIWDSALHNLVTYDSADRPSLL